MAVIPSPSMLLMHLALYIIAFHNELPPPFVVEVILKDLLSVNLPNRPYYFSVQSMVQGGTFGLYVLYDSDLLVNI